MIPTPRLKVKSRYKEAYLSLLKLGAPVMVTQLGVIVVNFADTMMVGAYGLDELAAAAFVNSLFLVLMVMLMGFAAGITPLVGALYSVRKNYDVGRTLRVGLLLNTLVAVCFTAIMGGVYFMLDHFGQPDEILPLVRRYYLIILATMIPMSIFNCCQQTCNGVTDTATPMWMIIGANVLNIIGNYMLIFGHFGAPELGLAGAGISTLTARCVAMLSLVTIILTSRRYRPYRDGLVRGDVTRRECRRIWTTSYPVMIQNGIECGLWSFGAVVSGWFGKVQLAAYQVVNTIAQLGFMTYMSFGVATSIRVANFAGLRDKDNIRVTATAGVHLNLVLSTVASLVFIAFTRQLIQMFTDSPEVVDVASALIIPLVLYQYFDAFQLTYANAIRGTSYVKPLLWVSIVSYVVVGIPVLLLFAKGFELKTLGVYYSFDVALVVAALMLYLWFRKIQSRLYTAA